VGLAGLALKAVILIGKMIVDGGWTTSTLSLGVSLLLSESLCQQWLSPLTTKYLLLEFTDAGLIEGIEGLEGELEVLNQSIASTASKVLANNHTHKLELLRVGCHGVGWNDPTTLAKVVCHSELVVKVAALGVQAYGNQWKTLTASLGKNNKSEMLECRREVVGRSRKIHHDRAVSTLAEADELVVLANDLRSSTGEVQCERCLIGT
jgi:hypothetical protein